MQTDLRFSAVRYTGLFLPDRMRKSAALRAVPVDLLSRAATNSLTLPMQSFPMVPYRIGLGFDTHRLADGGPLRIGGIDLPFDRHLVGHSDADVLLHAITDALLGAAALGDIGQQFPNTDPRNRGRNSSDFLRAAVVQLRQAGWSVGNIDCVVSAQRPKFLPHLLEIRQSIARLLEVSVDCIGLKGKTGEHVGPVGREEVIEARCVALVYRA